MPVCDFGEIVAIEPRHVLAVMRTHADDDAFTQSHLGAELRRAALALADAAGTQSQDAVVWLLPAEPLRTLAHWADGLSVYGLDELLAASFDHPAVYAEYRIMCEIAQQAPRTAAAMDAVDQAELICILADHHNK